MVPQENTGLGYMVSARSALVPCARWYAVQLGKHLPMPGWMVWMGGVISRKVGRWGTL